MKNRKSATFTIEQMDEFHWGAILWADRYQHMHYLTDNGIKNYPFGGFNKILAVDVDSEEDVFEMTDEKSLQDFQDFYDKNNDWMFGCFSYDLKNDIENLVSENNDFHQFPKALFFIPRHLFFFKDNEVTIYSSEKDPELIVQEVWRIRRFADIDYEWKQTILLDPLQIRTDKEEYIKNVNKIKEHILEGDVYELNYCIEFFAERAYLEDTEVYKALNEVSPMPFSTFFKDAHYRTLMCASPERFLKKEGNKLISQPIKGTARRGKTPEEDELLKNQLKNSEKERAENMMIVDLVRNDLAKISETGSVKVHEMFGIYTFDQLHQMISTVTSTIRTDIKFIDIINATFPMGSMTGAPKIKSMELIEQYENFKRGLYSGASGYITPEGDFDFNVIIRSIVFDLTKEKFSFQVGSAITFDSDPEHEYEECLLKAKAIKTVLEEKTAFELPPKMLRKKNKTVNELTKMLISFIFYFFILNYFINKTILIFNINSFYISLVIFICLTFFYWRFKKIEYWKSTGQNLWHNLFAQLLNGPAALLYLISAAIFIGGGIVLGGFFTIYRLIFPEKPFDLDEANALYEKRMKNYK